MMDSILSSRQSLDVDDDDDSRQLEEEIFTEDAHPSSRRSYNRYDTDEDLYSSDLSYYGEEDCCFNNPWALEELTLQLRANSPDFFQLELDDQLTEGIEQLTAAMNANTTVREVEVHIEALEGLSQKDQTVLADALCRLPELRSLLVYKNSATFLAPLARHRPILLSQLRLCKLDIAEPKTMEELNLALQELPNLKFLDVGFEANDSDEVLEAIAQLRYSCGTLESLRMDYKLLQQPMSDEYTIDDRIVAAIAQVVEQSETLKSLSLPPFGCTDQCHQTMIQMLQRNCVLEQMDYWVRICNLYYPDTNETIDHLLHLNRSGVRRLIKNKQGNIAANELWEQVEAHHSDVEVMYRLFSSDPSLIPVHD